MLNLLESYLIIVLLAFGFNIGLFLSDFKLSKLKYVLISVLLAATVYILVDFSNIFQSNLLFMNANLGWLFIVIAIMLFFIEYLYIKMNKALIPVIGVTCLFLVLVFVLSSQFNELNAFNSLLYSLFLFVILVISYPISKMLHYAKNEFSNIVGEYMSIEAILLFIFGITFWSILSLDYSMFSSFLILTPTYQLAYVIIGLIIVMILGLLYNDKKGDNLWLFKVLKL